MIFSGIPRAFGLVTTEEERGTQIERVSRLFTWVLLTNFVLGIGIAAFVATQADLNHNFFHEHILGTSLSRLVFIVPALLLSHHAPRSVWARHVIAFTAIMQSFWLIIATGGRIEGHFSVFIILATIAFYLDWKLFITATIAGTGYHCVIGMLHPMLVYGVPQATMWRCAEHGGWILYEVVILVVWINIRLGAISTIVGLRQQLASVAEKTVLAQENASRLKTELADARIHTDNNETELNRIHRELAYAEERVSKHQKALNELLKRLLGKTMNHAS